MQNGHSRHTYALCYEGFNLDRAASDGPIPPLSPLIPDGLHPSGANAEIRFVFTTTSHVAKAYQAFAVGNLIAGTFFDTEEARLSPLALLFLLRSA